MKKYVICYPDKCTGCGLCEFACSIHRTKRIQPSASLIRTVRVEPEIAMAVTCFRCEDPTCVRTCMKNAIERDQASGILVINESKCTGCAWCALTCEIGAIRLDPTKKVAVACDLCQGDPACVKICPVDALKFESIDAATYKKGEKVAAFFYPQKTLERD